MAAKNIVMFPVKSIVKLYAEDLGASQTQLSVISLENVLDSTFSNDKRYKDLTKLSFSLHLTISKLKCFSDFDTKYGGTSEISNHYFKIFASYPSLLKLF